jgi:hypothetical protein
MLPDPKFEDNCMADKSMLAAALEALIEADGSLTEYTLARAAGVAPKTLKRVLEGKFVGYNTGGVQMDADEFAHVDARQKRAWAEALARLSVFVSRRAPSSGITPEAEIAAAGLALTDREVVQAIGRVRAGQNFSLGITDEVLENITSRADHLSIGRGGLHGRIRGGLLEWEPFLRPDSKLNQSFSYRFCMRLLAAINPLGWTVELSATSWIDNSLDKLQGGIESLDFVFGIYDTVERRVSGYDFIHFPGLGIPQEALYKVDVRTTDSPPTWGEIANPPAENNPYYATVLRGAVGERYLRGPAQYHPDDVRPLNVVRPSEVARALALNPGPPDKICIFVADNPTCSSVKFELDKLKVDSIDNIDGGISWKFLGLELPRRASAPIFRVSLAIRRGAVRWKEILTTALIEELFRNDCQWTVDQYLELLKNHYGKIRLLPLEPDIPFEVGRVFAQRMRTAIERDQKAFDPWRLEELKKDFNDTWAATPVVGFPTTYPPPSQPADGAGHAQRDP